MWEVIKRAGNYKAGDKFCLLFYGREGSYSNISQFQKIVKSKIGHIKHKK